MRILHLSNHCIFGNGNVHAAIDLACEQAKQGHDVFFASSGGDFEGLLKENGVHHIKVNQPSKSNPLAGFATIASLIKIIRYERIDIVHAHMMTGAVLGWAATRLTRKPLITTVHNAFDKHAVLMGFGDRVIAVSQAVAETMRKRGIDSKKIRVVLNGTLGSARTSGEIKETVQLNRPSVTTVCGLHDRKGVKYLLQAFESVFESHPEAHLYIVGEGPQEEEYKAIAAQLKASPNIHFVGQVRDPRPYLRETDIFVLASLQDPCPLVIPEAREMGCAIVASNVDGIPEMLAIGNAGVLVEPRNSNSVADGIRALLCDLDYLKQQKLLSESNIHYFKSERVCADTLVVYDSLQAK